MSKTMARSSSRASISSDQELNAGAAQIEYQKLQRRYRLMEMTKRIHTDESRITINKQRNSIEKLMKDKQYILEEKNLLEAELDQTKQTAATREKIQHLHEQADVYSQGIKACHSRIVELDEAIKNFDQQIAEIRASMGGINAPSASNSAILKQIRILENRLDKALVKYNKALASNKKLRGVLDNFRRERIVFDNVSRKMQKQLAEKKKNMADIIEASNNAYEARDEAQNRLTALKEKADKENQAYSQELKELNRSYEHDRKLREFMAIKGSERLGSARLEGRKKETEGEQASKGSQDTVNETVNNYENMFSKIRDVTSITDINELVNTFNQVEAQNFSLFNYVNELNNEIENINEEVKQTNNKIEKLHRDELSTEKISKTITSDYELQFNSTTELSNQYESLYNVMADILVDLKKGVKEICSDIGCDKRKHRPSSAVVNELYGASTTVEEEQEISDTNLMQWLSLIEQRTNELLLLDYAYNRDRGESTGPLNKSGTMLGQGPTAPVGPISIIPPSTGDEHDTEEGINEEEDRPLTYEELKAKIIRSINKREKSGLKQAKIVEKRK